MQPGSTEPPRKKMKSVQTCGYCQRTGHNVLNCAPLKQLGSRILPDMLHATLSQCRQLAPLSNSSGRLGRFVLLHGMNGHDCVVSTVTNPTEQSNYFAVPVGDLETHLRRSNRNMLLLHSDSDSSLVGPIEIPGFVPEAVTPGAIQLPPLPQLVFPGPDTLDSALSTISSLFQFFDTPLTGAESGPAHFQS
jgi:hypothetical protein